MTVLGLRPQTWTKIELHSIFWTSLSFATKALPQAPKFSMLEVTDFLPSAFLYQSLQ